MEAALTLPVFILCIVALALVIRVIGICENISYVTCQETRKIALNAYHDLNAVSPLQMEPYCRGTKGKSRVKAVSSSKF